MAMASSPDRPRDTNAALGRTLVLHRYGTGNDRCLPRILRAFDDISAWAARTAFSSRGRSRVVFFAWLLLFLVQSVLIDSPQRLHRRMGIQLAIGKIVEEESSKQRQTLLALMEKGLIMPDEVEGSMPKIVVHIDYDPTVPSQ